jgi:tRNA-dihydrouridine synthase A
MADCTWGKSQSRFKNRTINAAQLFARRFFMLLKQYDFMSHSPWRLSVAPMMDWTDRHCRFFHRLLSKDALLYTEMVTTGALLHGDVHRHLRYNEEEHPLALQLGGSDHSDLAAAAKLAKQYGYDEVNLNCGCPSERVQKGAFGACLMAEAPLVADCVKAMQDAVDLPVTVKHRIGIDKSESYEFVRDFVGTLYRAGCRVFIVHARSAWLKGLSPKENREIPPLRYEFVYKLKVDFPDCTIVLNGGVKTNDEIEAHLAHVDGVMLGREAYHNPWLMQAWDARFFGKTASSLDRETVEADMIAYMQRTCHKEKGEKDGLMYPSVYSVARHILGLRHGQAGARAWKQKWSDKQQFREHFHEHFSEHFALSLPSND